MAEQSPSAQSAPAIEEPDGLVCPRCGYDLRAISSENCPECGLPIDRTSISLSRIPWEHCKELGYFRGFWDTTGYAVFHPLQLAKEVYRPISYRRARWFQRIVVLWAWIPTAFWLIAALIPETNSRWDVRVPTITIAVLVLGMSLSLATGIASYWFHPKTLSVSHQNRAIALSYYACSPLAWLWLPAVLLAAERFIPHNSGVFYPQFVILTDLGEIGFGILLVTWLITTSVLMSTITKRGARQTVRFAVVLPFLWLLCFGISAAVPVAGYFFWVVIHGLR